MKTAHVYCPGAISLIFRVWPTGSTGVGFTIDQGVIATVSESEKTRIVWNEKEIVFPTVLEVVQNLTNKPIMIKLTSLLPLGAGFGMSGASALSSAYAINELLQLKKTKEELLFICHRAEMNNKTGLGTVGTQTTGGFLLKKKPGIPVSAQKFSFENKKVYSYVFNSITTDKVLKNETLTQLINAAADKTLDEISHFKNPKLEDFFSTAKAFAYSSGIPISHMVKQTISNVEKKGGVATIHMVGNAVVVTEKSAIPNSGKIFELQITNDTVRLL